MGAIGVSATLPNSDKHSIYKARHPAICLSSSVKLGASSTPVSFTKFLPTGEEIELSSLQGVFFGKESQLLAKASNGCQIEVTLVSQSVDREYQIIYPAPQAAGDQNETTIDSAVCNSCSVGSRVLRFDGIPGGQIPFTVSVRASITSESLIKVYRWLVEPKCPPLTEGIDVETIAILPSEGGNFVLTILDTPTIVSFLAQNSNQNNTSDLVCFAPLTQTGQTTVSLEAFPNEEANPSGGY